MGYREEVTKMLSTRRPSKAIQIAAKLVQRIRAECPNTGCAECHFYNRDRRECMFAKQPYEWDIPTDLLKKIEP
jgi:hypothetical protein